jgi:cytoskeletal protein CcmA (bactofilin family)
MGTGYVRADTANNISNGNVIDADDLDNEFNAVEAAFNVSTGHTHDGTASEGAPIEVLGPSQDIIATVSTLRPKTTNTVDLGTTTLRYKDLYLEGNADIDGTVNVEGATTLQSTLAAGNVTITGDLTVSGDATISGNLTFGDAITDTITLTADVSSNILPSADDTYDLGAAGSEWKDLYIDGTANIDTASIDTANITTLAVSGNGTVTGNLTVSGSINATVSGNSTTADSLSTERTITLDGDVSGAVNFDGSANVTLTTTIADDSHNHTIANVDGLQTALDAKQATITGAATTIDDADLTADRAVISDASGKVAVSSVTSTELGRLSGVSSAIQTQLDAKLDSVDLSSYTGDVDITGELVVDSYNETYAAITSSSGTATIDCEAGNVFALTLSENVTTFTWSNPPASGTAYGFSLKVIQGSSDYTISWPPAVDWPDATAPTLTSGSGAVDQFVFYTHDGGTTWYGFVAGQALG